MALVTPWALLVHVPRSWTSTWYLVCAEKVFIKKGGCKSFKLPVAGLLLRGHKEKSLHPRQRVHQQTKGRTLFSSSLVDQCLLALPTGNGWLKHGCSMRDSHPTYLLPPLQSQRGEEWVSWGYQGILPMAFLNLMTYLLAPSGDVSSHSLVRVSYGSSRLLWFKMVVSLYMSQPCPEVAVLCTIVVLLLLLGQMGWESSLGNSRLQPITVGKSGQALKVPCPQSGAERGPVHGSLLLWRLHFA